MKQIIFKLLLILSPLFFVFLFGYLSQFTSSHPGNMASGIWAIMIVVFGIPFIAVVGLVVSILTRNSLNAEKVATYGYLAPAILVGLLALPLLS